MNKFDGELTLSLSIIYFQFFNLILRIFLCQPCLFYKIRWIMLHNNNISEYD